MSFIIHREVILFYIAGLNCVAFAHCKYVKYLSVEFSCKEALATVQICAHTDRTHLQDKVFDSFGPFYCDLLGIITI